MMTASNKNSFIKTVFLSYRLLSPFVRFINTTNEQVLSGHFRCFRCPWNNSFIRYDYGGNLGRGSVCWFSTPDWIVDTQYSFEGSQNRQRSSRGACETDMRRGPGDMVVRRRTHVLEYKQEHERPNPRVARFIRSLL